MVENTSCMLALFCASFTSRDLDWRCIATSRALRSLSTTNSSSPAFGAPDKPSTTTGLDGLPSLIEQCAHAAEFLADEQRVAELESAAQHEHRCHRAAALLQTRLD